MGKCSCFNLQIVLVESLFLASLCIIFLSLFYLFLFLSSCHYWYLNRENCFWEIFPTNDCAKLISCPNHVVVDVVSFPASLTRKEFSILMRHNANIASTKNRLNGVENLFCSCVSKICWLPWNGRNHFGPVHPKFFVLESQKATAFVIR